MTSSHARFECKLYFVPGSKFEVGAVSFGRVGGTDALSFATFHHPLQNCTFAETVALFEAPPEF